MPNSTRPRRRALRLALIGYAAILVAPAATIASGPTWPLFAGGLIAGALAAIPVTDRFKTPGAILSLTRLLVGFCLPLAWLYPAARGASSVGTFLYTPWVAGALAAVIWGAVVLIAAEWRQRQRLDALTELVVFDARDPPETRRQTTLAAGTLLVVVAAGVLVLALTDRVDDSDTMIWLLPSMVPAWIPLLTDRDGTEVAITDGGLRVERQLHDWSTIDRYELDETTLTFSRPRWYHADLSFDRSDINDVAAVSAALEEVGVPPAAA